MRIFLLLLIESAAFVAGILVGSAILSPRGSRLLGAGRTPAWLAGLLLPTVALLLTSVRAYAWIGRSGDWGEFPEIELPIVQWMPVPYFVGYLLGGVPRRWRESPVVVEESPAAPEAGEESPAPERVQDSQFEPEAQP